MQHYYLQTHVSSFALYSFLDCSLTYAHTCKLSFSLALSLLLLPHISRALHTDLANRPMIDNASLNRESVDCSLILLDRPLNALKWGTIHNRRLSWWCYKGNAFASVAFFRESTHIFSLFSIPPLTIFTATKEREIRRRASSSWSPSPIVHNRLNLFRTFFCLSFYTYQNRFASYEILIPLNTSHVSLIDI